MQRHEVYDLLSEVATFHKATPTERRRFADAVEVLTLNRVALQAAWRWFSIGWNAHYTMIEEVQRG